MKAIVRERGEPAAVLESRDSEAPSVSDDGVLVRIRAASTNPYDWHFMRGKPLFARAMFGWFKPKAHGLGAGDRPPSWLPRHAPLDEVDNVPIR